ncbi:hypothetical protein [Xanthobacter sediminis]
MSEDAKWNGAVTTTAGIILGVLATSVVAAAAGGKIDGKDWLQFAGSIFGGTMALGAALVAWLAMRRQVAAHQQSFSLATDEHRKRMVRLLHLISEDVAHARGEVAKEKNSLDRLGPMGIPAAAISTIPGISANLQDADIWRLSRMQIRRVEKAQHEIDTFNASYASRTLGADKGAIIQGEITRLDDVLSVLFTIIESWLKELGEPRKALPGQKFSGHFYLR